MSLPAPTPPPVAERTAHPFLTYDMIQQIPDAVRETLRRAAEPAQRAGASLADRSFLYFTGCGTAFFSAMLAQRLAAPGAVGPSRSAAVPAVELSAYTAPTDSECGVIGVSHSGITKATVDALADARRRGAGTVAVTHFADRPIAAASDHTLVVGNGPDRSRCHTKCYVTGALGAALVGLEWATATGQVSAAEADARRAALLELPDLQERVLRSVEPACAEAAADHLGRRSTFLVGAGPNEPTALEVALKLKETSFIAAEGMETEQFLHGSFQAADSDSLLIVLAPPGPGRGRALDSLHAARTVGAHTIAVADDRDREIAEASELTLPIPLIEESLSPLLYVLPLYLYAYHASVRRGHNPDVLRYLEPKYWAARQIVFPPGTH